MKNKVKILLENILKEAADRPKIKLRAMWQDREERRLKQYEKILSQETFDGDLYLEDSPIENLGNIRHVKGNLNLLFCKQLKELPAGLIVDGWLDLSGCISLQSLPPDLKVGGHLWLVLCKRDVIKQAFEVIPNRAKVTY